MKFIIAFLFAAFLFHPVAALAADDEAVTRAEIAATQAEINDAIEKVVAIVNQPVTHLVRLPTTHVAVFSPGWFHDGAIEPDFNKVDIRKTQTLPYAKNDYVSSDLNPTEKFIGNELEFNSMTKYFYTDRTIPKKRLSEAEMVEVNRLYRIIGKGEAKLARLKKPKSGFSSLLDKIHR